MKHPCDIVKDLLPLYIEQVVSDETCQFIEAHLAVCPSCQKELQLLTTPVSLPAEQNIQPLQRFQKQWHRKLIQTVFLTAIILCSLFIAFLFFYQFEIPCSYYDVQLEPQLSNIPSSYIDEHGKWQTAPGSFSIQVSAKHSIRFIMIPNPSHQNNSNKIYTYRVVYTTPLRNHLKTEFQILGVGHPAYWLDDPSAKTTLILQFSDRTLRYINGVLTEYP